MDTQALPPGPAEDVPPDDYTAPVEPLPPMMDQIRSLYADGRTLIEAEFGYQLARLAYVGREARAIAALAGLGFVLLGGVLLVLVVGATIQLTPLLGPMGAAGVVAGVTLLLALFCIWRAVQRFDRLGDFIENAGAHSEPPPPISNGSDPL